MGLELAREVAAVQPRSGSAALVGWVFCRQVRFRLARKGGVSTASPTRSLRTTRRCLSAPAVDACIHEKRKCRCAKILLSENAGALIAVPGRLQVVRSERPLSACGDAGLSREAGAGPQALAP
jgi:hypothetical protein